MTVTVSLRGNQASPLSWNQVDDNFSGLAAQVNANTEAIAAGVTPQGGPTSSRPATPVLYQPYFDTTLGYTINCKQVSPAIWVNASGVSV